MADRNFKDLTRKAASDNLLRDKAFKISKTPKNDGYECRLSSMIYKFFDEKILG